ncbi:MAG TPA: hypothetical protein VEZ16_00230 [Microvirga sp.]|nr:hypothetical protein [Microvirga sp.]
MPDKYSGLKFWGVLGLAAALLMVVAASLSCRSGFAFSELQKPAAAGCFEFWLNRYQTTVAAAGALLAAFLAARPVWRQLTEMRHQLTEMKRQTAQQSFQVLRALHVQLSEEKLIVRDIRLNAQYCLIFENGLTGNTGDPSYAILHEEDFKERYEALNTLERALLEISAKNWGNSDMQKARDQLRSSCLSLRQRILSVRQRLNTILVNFRGNYVVANWQRTSMQLTTITLKPEVADLLTKCDRLDAEISREQAVIGPALDNATTAAFDLKA